MADPVLGRIGSFIIASGGAAVARIYLSSTYSDLREHREKVYRVLRQLGHDVIAAWCVPFPVGWLWRCYVDHRK